MVDNKIDKWMQDWLNLTNKTKRFGKPMVRKKKIRRLFNLR